MSATGENWDSAAVDTTFQQSISVPLNQLYQFSVTVCGDQSPVCSEPAAPAANAGTGRQLWVGAYMSAALSGAMPGQIVGLSQPVQPVILDTDSATWSWEVDPSEAGTFDLTLTVTPLLANTRTPLEAAVPYPIRLTVTESTGQRLSTIAVKWGGSFIDRLAEVLGALGLTAAGIATWFWQRVRKRRAKQPEPQLNSPAPAGSAPDVEHAPEPGARDTTVTPSNGAAPPGADGSKATSG